MLPRYGDVGMCSRMDGGILENVWRRVESSRRGLKTLNKVRSRSEESRQLRMITDAQGGSLKLEVLIEVAQRCSKMSEWVCRCLNGF
jgi:hypothetical protein